LSYEVKEDVLGRDEYRLLVRKGELKNHCEDLDVNGSLILKWILERRYGVILTGFIWPRIGTSEGLL
jgi:hypothetical protein